MLRNLWLIFAQTVTVALALAFTLAILRPEWLPPRLQPQPTAATPAQSAPTHSVPEAAAPTPPGAGDEVAPATGSYRQGARRATAAVVNIFTTKTLRGSRRSPFGDPLLRRFFGDAPEERQSASLGSGVIVSADGDVLTANHVVEGADAIEVLLADGTRAPARIIGTDPETDLAVLRIQANGLPAIEFGDIDAARVGDVVLAVGNPFGVGQTVTMGIISALGRTELGINTFENFIQTDAAINPGNSGGALVDTDGRLLGINTAIYSRSGGSLGIGFAIPVSTARQIMRQIVVHGAVTRGYIGVEPQDITPELARAFSLPREHGAIVAGIVRNGPADRAGVRIGDILVEVDHKTITGTASMLDTVAQLQPGSTVVFRFLRDGRLLEVPIHIGRRPSRQG